MTIVPCPDKYRGRGISVRLSYDAHLMVLVSLMLKIRTMWPERHSKFTGDYWRVRIRAAVAAYRECRQWEFIPDEEAQ